jgi:DNA-directed RNA polymerase subunit RPC12/RpoP
LTAGWACDKCGARRIRTLIVDDVPSAAPGLGSGSLETKCPVCGHRELVFASGRGERVTSVRYSVD